MERYQTAFSSLLLNLQVSEWVEEKKFVIIVFPKTLQSPKTPKETKSSLISLPDFKRAREWNFFFLEKFDKVWGFFRFFTNIKNKFIKYVTFINMLTARNPNTTGPYDSGFLQP